MPSVPVRPRAHHLFLLLSVLLLLPLTGLGGAPAQAATPTVTGTVIDALGDPVSGVSVQARSAATPSEVTASAVTGADGGYGLVLPAGSHRLEFTKSGYASAWYAEEAVLVVTADGGVSVDGEPIEDGLLDDVELAATSTHAVTGAVAGAAGQPLAGIRAALYADPTDEEPVASTVTDSSGAFSFAVPRGYYYLRLSDPSHVHVDVWYGDEEQLVVDGDLALGTVTLEAGSTTAEYPLAGAAVDALGVGINGLTVTATGVGATGGTVTGTTLGDDVDAGGFSLSVLPGTYALSFAATGFLTTAYPGTVTVAPNGTLSVSPAEPLVGNRLPEVTIASTPFAVNGTVLDDATSTPLAQITVRATGDDDTPITATTGVAGGYALPLPIGSYSVEAADLDGVAPQYVSGWLGGSADVILEVAQQGVLTLDAGEPIAVLPALRLRQASADSTYAVTGWVVDANGDGVPGVTASATPVPGTPLGAPASAVSAAGEDAGRFELALKAGTYQLRTSATPAFGSGFLTTDDESVASVRVSATGVTVDGEDALDGDLGSIVLPGLIAHPLTGSVSDGETGLPGITVEARFVDDDAVAATAVTDAAGVFAFTGAGSAPGTAHGLRVGTYKLRFTDRTSNAVRYRDAWFGGDVPAEVQVGQDGAITVDGEAVTLAAVLTAVSSDATFDLLGLVYDPDFTPLDGVTVTATPLAGTPGGQQVSGVTGSDPTYGEAGVYRLAVRPGSYRMHFTKDDYQPQTLSDYESGAPVTVTVSATGTITAPGLDLFDGVIDDVQLYLRAAEFATRPALTGKVAVGSTLVATFGSLKGVALDRDSVYVEWFLDGKEADDHSAGASGQKFKVTHAAAGRKLTFRVTVDDPDGMRAPSVFTSAPVTVPKAPATVTGKVKKGKLTITVAVPTWTKPTGTVVVKDGKKVLAKITLKAKSNGKAVLDLAKLKPGKHKLTISYTGPSTVKPAKAKLTYKR